MFRLLPLLCIAIFASQARATALDDYVAAPDSAYRYELAQTIVRTEPLLGSTIYTGYIIDMTSQSWRSPAEVDRSEWRHWLTIVVPPVITHDRAVLVVVGADNTAEPDTDVVDYIGPLALMYEAVVAVVESVPNQPLLFAGESQPRSSDEIIAYSWDKYFNSADPAWIAQLPMTKSVVRAMDTVQSFLVDLAVPVAVDSFVVTGASKHGWATWLTAAVDGRVAVAIPLVIDLLNMDRSFRHHFAAYGFWADAVSSYDEMGIFQHIGTPEMDELISIVDPYVYRDRLAGVRRLIVNSTGDEFFLPDSSRFSFADLPPEGSAGGGKYLRYVPNTGHSLEGANTIDTLTVYLEAALSDSPLPQFSWNITENGAIEVQTTGQSPREVWLWQATNPDARDFRYTSIGGAWTRQAAIDLGDGRYLGVVTPPAQGWTGYFLELIYPGDGPADYAFTTTVQVIPDSLPFAADVDFDGEIEGDVNGDGQVSLTDAITCLQVLAGHTVYAERAADFDGDRRIGLADCIYILNWLGE